jgi:L-iditol 2-dehydrogenase
LIDIAKPRLEKAREIGIADVYVCPAEQDIVQAVLDETKGLGADVIYTACPSGQAQADALRMAKNRAQVNFFGGLPKGTIVPLDTNIIHYKELFVTGAHGSMPVHHRKALDLIESGRINVKPYISHRFPLDEIEKAFATAEGQGGLRVVVCP